MLFGVSVLSDFFALYSVPFFPFILLPLPISTFPFLPPFLILFHPKESVYLIPCFLPGPTSLSVYFVFVLEFFFLFFFSFPFLSNQEPIEADFRDTCLPADTSLYGLCDVFFGTSANGCPSRLLPHMLPNCYISWSCSAAVHAGICLCQ